ncbi:hypothetical protein Tco_0440838, partial [Tanacetum coccineum]
CKIKAKVQKNAKVRVNTEESAVKPEPELKNTIECNLNPSDGPGKPNNCEDFEDFELTLRIGSEAITYNLDQTSRYSANYTHKTANKIDVIDMACEEYPKP